MLMVFRDSTEIEYEILSAIASVWSVPRRSAVASLVMDFDHGAPEGNHRTWTLNCAVTEFAAFSYGWEPQLCQTTVINSTRTRCECATSGTFAVLLTKRASSVSVFVVGMIGPHPERICTEQKKPIANNYRNSSSPANNLYRGEPDPRS